MVYFLEFFKQFPVFSGLTDDELGEVAEISNHRIFPKGTNIFIEGEERKAVYFILSGLVKVYKVNEKGQEQIISFLHSDEMFPHVGFFDETPYPATAVTINKVELLSIPIEEFEILMLRKPEISIKVMRVMGKKLLEMQNRIQSITTQSVFSRIISTLLRFSKELGEQQEDGTILIRMPMTNTDLASLIGVTRESVNRTLNRLKKEGIVTHSRKEISILDEKKLIDYT
ncbi:MULTISPECIES: Crp/Fnr family transcriptional regulator [Allobacillus]|uniref:Crp/Fnr family transcriptional regulator n=1 Tax=Allobacillus salarius TaxID=1955272 RepID=A0A556PLP0_9BACI|nr:Crp/Fnr family transcriptional regulator [Allobacillus salarius]TSJ65313.1 Crp/Fnr family transcriptional regulator [Allobacillus salarius]